VNVSVVGGERKGWGAPTFRVSRQARPLSRRPVRDGPDSGKLAGHCVLIDREVSCTSAIPSCRLPCIFIRPGSGPLGLRTVLNRQNCGLGGYDTSLSSLFPRIEHDAH